LEQLPGAAQTQIYVTYLFKNFYNTYKSVFNLRQNEYKLRRTNLYRRTQSVGLPLDTGSHYDMTRYFLRGSYDEFIVTILRRLEPMQVWDGMVFQKEEQDVINETFFLMSGQILVGYNYRRYVLEY